MKKNLCVMFGVLILILITSCGEEYLSDADKYCMSEGGVIETSVKDNKEVKICFINDGIDGIRCKVDGFYEKSCGHNNNS